MKVLITGGAGCIGDVLAKQSLARGEQVHVVDSLLRGVIAFFISRRGANE